MKDVEKKDSEDLFLSKYYVYIGPFIIFLGMARLIFFYKTFGISIVNYLEFSEIITSFFDIIVILVLYLSFLIIQNYLTRNKNIENKTDELYNKIIEEKKQWRRTLLYFNYVKVLIYFALFIVIVSLVSNFFYETPSSYVIKLLTSVFIFIIFVVVISVEIERKHKLLGANLNTKKFYKFIFLSFIVVITVIVYSAYQSNVIKNDKSTYGVTIVFDNDQIFVSDSSTYFIGKTQNYIYIHHQKEKKTDAIPMSRVKKLTFPVRTIE